MASTYLRIEIDDKALYNAIQQAENLPELLTETSSRITSKANAMSSGFRTEEYTDPKTKEKLGNQQPSYRSNVKMMKRTLVGLVYTGNYAAIRENLKNNTLAKAMG